jgi:hypothetical protein
MKRSLWVIVFLISLWFTQSAYAACARIKDGTLKDVKGNTLTLGYDQWGYNYQAHMFNGLYENYSRPDTPVTESDTNLRMKWSDEWLSNQDCSGDGLLDRGWPNTDNISRGWLTNHMEGDYEDAGEYYHWTYFVKIVYVGPVDEIPDPWEGKRIWGVYAIIEEVLNDPHAGFHGVDRENLVKPAGFGYWTQ